MGMEVSKKAGIVGIYARVSTQEQSRTGRSLENQIEIMRREIDGRWPGVEIREYQEVHSGRKTNRRQYKAMMNAAKYGYISVIAAVEISRLWRSLGDAIRDLARLESWGTQVIIRDVGIDTTTPVGKLQTAIISALAQFESDQVSDRVKRAHAETRRAGRKGPGRRPYGWRQDDNGLMQRVPEEQAAIDKVVYMRAQNSTWQACADELNRLEIPTVSGGFWDPGGVRLILSSVVRRRAEEESRSADDVGQDVPGA